MIIQNTSNNKRIIKSLLHKKIKIIMSYPKNSRLKTRLEVLKELEEELYK